MFKIYTDNYCLPWSKCSVDSASTLELFSIDQLIQHHRDTTELLVYMIRLRHTHKAGNDFWKTLDWAPLTKKTTIKTRKKSHQYETQTPTTLSYTTQDIKISTLYVTYTRYKCNLTKRLNTSQDIFKENISENIWKINQLY